MPPRGCLTKICTGFWPRADPGATTRMNERLLKWVRRRPLAAALIAVTALAVIAAAAGGAMYSV